MYILQAPSFTSLVEGLLQQHHVPGLAIAVVQNGTTASAAYGHASLDPPVHCTADTLFNIASASKSLTAASVGLLVHDDSYPEMQYEATMSSFLPEDFVLASRDYTDNVTIEDVLSHRTGMPSHDYSYMGVMADIPDTAKSITRNLRNLQMAAPIRTKYIYCNMMYTAASFLVEQVSKTEFADFLDKHFFQPLGMVSTALEPSRARDKGLGDRMAMGYSWDSEAQTYNGFETPDSPEAQGAGFIITSVNDYIKYVKAMVNHEPPFSKDIYDGIIKARTLEDPTYEEVQSHTSPPMYATGWSVRWYRGHMTVSHDGSDPGFGSNHFFVPDFNFGGVIFGNSDGASTVATTLTDDLIDRVMGVPDSQRSSQSGTESKPKAGEDRGGDDETQLLRQELCPNVARPTGLNNSLSAYTGEYSNTGYHTMRVEIDDDRLFINATDRSMGFTLSFDHVCNGTKFIAHLSDMLEGGDEPHGAEFVLDDGIAVRMGLDLEEELGELIWFDKASGQVPKIT